MRARAGAEGLAIGRRSRGRAAMCMGEGTDGWGYPVSGCVRERERARACAARMRAGSSGPVCGPVSRQPTAQ